MARTGGANGSGQKGWSCVLGPTEGANYGDFFLLERPEDHQQSEIGHCSQRHDEDNALLTQQEHH
jgi:hypothetical protein